MAANKLNKTQKEYVKTVAYLGSLCQKPLTSIVKQIEEEIGVKLAPSTVQDYIEKVREELRQSRMKAIDVTAERFNEVEFLRAIRMDSLQQWHRSKEPAEVTETEKLETSGGETNGSKMKAKLKRTGQCGDPRYVSNAVSISREISLLLGLYQPTKVQLTDWRMEALKSGASKEDLTKLEELHAGLVEQLAARLGGADMGLGLQGSSEESRDSETISTQAI